MKNNTTEENHLIRMFKEGHKSVFSDLVNPYYNQAYKIAFDVLNQHHDAEDATQNAFIKIYRSLDKFKGEASFKNWLLRIVRNHAIDIYRSNQRTVKIKDSFKGAVVPEINQVTKTSNVILNDIKSELSTLIDSISPSYEEVIKLRFMESLSYEEISETLMCSVGTVKSRISRGREQIRMLMSSTQ